MKYSLLLLIFLFTIQSTVASDYLSQKPVSHPEKEKFMFLINSDPQMGEENTKDERLQVLNQLLEQFVSEANNLAEKPDFVSWNGDLVWKPTQGAFDNFERIVKKMQIPSVLIHGNHDGDDSDPKFLKLQENISGYRKLNYSFDYGKWHFIVIASQEKYPTKKQKNELLYWLRNDLEANKDKQTMMFMHYHILSPGTSQLEFYTFFPSSFRTELLNEITKRQNVKYVFSGHTHIGVKASVKTARVYNGTKFVLVPTPVPARPFGEEFKEYDMPESPFDKRGFYMMVRVDGDNVELFGKKINHSFVVKYPEINKDFNLKDDLRGFLKNGEASINPNEELINGDFTNDLSGWGSSLRYQTDEAPAYLNYVENNRNFLKYHSKYGFWARDEYLENYQVIKYKPGLILESRFEIPELPVGGGGYIRMMAYKEGKLKKMGLIHWGNSEDKIKYMHQSWAYLATGNRKSPFWLNKMIASKHLTSVFLNDLSKGTHDLQLNVDEYLGLEKINIDSISIAYGVWGRVNPYATPFSSELIMDKISLDNENKSSKDSKVIWNGTELSDFDVSLLFGEIYKEK